MLHMKMGETFIPSEILHHILSFNLFPYTTDVCTAMKEIEDLLLQSRIHHMDSKYPDWNGYDMFSNRVIEMMVSNGDLEAIKFMLLLNMNTKNIKSVLNIIICKYDKAFLASSIFDDLVSSNLLSCAIVCQSSLIFLRCIEKGIPLQEVKSAMYRLLEMKRISRLYTIDWLQTMNIPFLQCL